MPTGCYLERLEQVWCSKGCGRGSISTKISLNVINPLVIGVLKILPLRFQNPESARAQRGYDQHPLPMTGERHTNRGEPEHHAPIFNRQRLFIEVLDGILQLQILVFKGVTLSVLV